MKMVNVIWLDTNECSLSGWQSKEELMESKPCTVSSLGYLIKEDKDCITITADKDHYDEDDLSSGYSYKVDLMMPSIPYTVSNYKFKNPEGKQFWIYDEVHSLLIRARTSSNKTGTYTKEW